MGNGSNFPGRATRLQYGRVVQRLECPPYTRKVPGSNPGAPTMEIPIIYEDGDFLIIDKPSGLLTHPVNREDKSPSVVGWVLEKYPEIAHVHDEYGASVGEWVDLRPGIVHRLDRETSGLLLIAKTQPSFNYLKNLFAERKIKKSYLALVYGHLKNQRGVIDAPLGKVVDRSGQGRQTTRINAKNKLKEKAAVTEYEVHEEYLDYSLVEARPQTGRTHQIRAHLRSIGHPVVCDRIYAGKKMVCPFELGRLFLHAAKLSFVSPAGSAITVESDLPKELDNFLQTLPKKQK